MFISEFAGREARELQNLTNLHDPTGAVAAIKFHPDKKMHAAVAMFHPGVKMQAAVAMFQRCSITPSYSRASFRSESTQRYRLWSLVQ